MWFPFHQFGLPTQITLKNEMGRNVFTDVILWHSLAHRVVGSQLPRVFKMEINRFLEIEWIKGFRVSAGKCHWTKIFPIVSLNLDWPRGANWPNFLSIMSSHNSLMYIVLMQGSNKLIPVPCDQCFCHFFRWMWKIQTWRIIQSLNWVISRNASWTQERSFSSQWNTGIM